MPLKSLSIGFSLMLLISSTANSQQKISSSREASRFAHAPGIVSFTFRKAFASDFSGTLDSIKKYGISDIEFSSLFGKTAIEIRHELDKRQISCSSFGVSYDDLMHRRAWVTESARALGASYVRLAWIPHTGKFTIEDTRHAVQVFDSLGKLFYNDSLHFVYHNHGYEFEPYEQGTLYDYLVSKTDPRYVNFELDILWAFFPGMDPARLLDKYAGRYKLLHLKDLRKGVQGNFSGGTDPDNDVVLGSGQLNLPQILKAAAKAGVGHYFLEDESSHSFSQVPQSISYLHNLH